MALEPTNPTDYLALSRIDPGEHNWDILLNENAETIDAESLRVNDIISNTWKESHTVLKDTDTMTLTNLYNYSDRLIIYDTEFGGIWEKDIHWTIEGQIITFTSVMPEDITFVVRNII